jgi:hypothetical protein
MLLIVGLGEECHVPPYPLSSFRRSQVTLELRYDEAFQLWDRTGSLWRELQRHFKSLKHNQVSPNQSTFVADNRFVLSVSLTNAVITDHKPTGGASNTVQAMSTFAEAVVEELQIPVLKRVGTRFIHSLRCKDADEVRVKLSEALPVRFAAAALFNVTATHITPSLKLDINDEELGYTAHLHAIEKRYDLEPPPDLSELNLDHGSQTINEMVFDVDFFTMRPLPTESFEPSVWLNGWNKTILRDADKLLDLFVSAK